MNVEEMLGKCKLREPSADLKARIAMATKDEWRKPAIVVEFRRSLWRVAIGLAASLLLAWTGIAVNSKLTSVGITQVVEASMESSSNTYPEMDIGAMGRMKISSVRRQSVDLKCFVKMHKLVDEELNKGG